MRDGVSCADWYEGQCRERKCHGTWAVGSTIGKFPLILYIRNGFLKQQLKNPIAILLKNYLDSNIINANSYYHWAFSPEYQASSISGSTATTRKISG